MTLIVHLIQLNSFFFVGRGSASSRQCRALQERFIRVVASAMRALESNPSSSSLPSFFHWGSKSTQSALGSHSTTSAMNHYHIFRHHLAVKFPAYGYALWEPGPGNLSPAAVEVGDVGYICQGRFRRLFNVLLPANHSSHRNYGVPDYHEQLTLNMENHIETSRLSPHDFCSAGVNSGPESDLWANG